MNKAWTDIHWRGLAVAVVALGVVVATRAAGEDVHSTPTLERAEASLRELPTENRFMTATAGAAAVRGVPSDGVAEQPAACSAQSRGYRNRDAQCALSSTITMTTANIVDRNAARAITLAYARP